MMRKRWVRRREEGFTLAELMVSTAIILVVAGSATFAIMYYQKQYRNSELRRSLQTSVRSAIEQISEDIGQAGLANSGLVAGSALAANSNVAYSSGSLIRLTATSPAAPSSLTVNRVDGLYVNQRVLIGAGGSAPPGQQEIVTITAISGLTLTVHTEYSSPGATTHAVGEPVIPFGVFPDGVLLPNSIGLANGISGLDNGGASNTSLRIVGDIGGGSVKMVIYQCPQQNHIGTLTRDVYDLSSGVPGAPESHVVLLDYVDNTADANGVYGCNFVYSFVNSSAAGASVTLANGNTAVFTVQVGIAIRACTTQVDAQTGQRICQMRSYMNVQPRNVINAFQQAVLSNTASLSTVAAQPANAQYQLQVRPSGTNATTLYEMSETYNNDFK